MKSRSSFIIRFLSLIFLLQSHFFATGQYVIKPKLGFTLSRIKEPPPDLNYFYQPSCQVLKLGLQGGAGIEYDLNSFFSAEADLLYTQKGLKDTTHLPSSTFFGYEKGFRYRFHYVELPLLFHFKADQHLKLGAGPSLSYLFKAEYFYGNKKKNNSNIDYSNWDFGLVADASWTVKRFEAGARFTYGISKTNCVRAYDDPELSTPVGVIGKNRSFQFYINYLIRR